VRAIQHTQFRAKSAKNDLKPTDFLKRNFYFETEGVNVRSSHIMSMVMKVTVIPSSPMAIIHY
jgi:hypothetical protein